MDKLSDPADSNAKLGHKTVQPHPSQQQDGPLKLGDMVMFYDENDRTVRGIVRWIGRNTNQLRSGAKIVGIEIVSSYIFKHVQLYSHT